MNSKDWYKGAKSWGFMGGIFLLGALLLDSWLLLIPATVAGTVAIVGFGYGYDEAKREEKELHDLFGHD